MREKCEWCGAVVMGATEIVEASPGKQDLPTWHLCSVCGGITLREKGVRRRPTDAEVEAEFNSTPGLREFIASVREQIHAHNQKHFGTVIQ